jgi:hypothetical protein
MRLPKKGEKKRRLRRGRERKQGKIVSGPVNGFLLWLLVHRARRMRGRNGRGSRFSNSKTRNMREKRKRETEREQTVLVWRWMESRREGS